MSRLPALAALLVLAACDAAPSGPDALVGRWTATETVTTTWATSRVDQSVPDFSGPADGAVTATGHAARSLAVVTAASRTGLRIATRPADDAAPSNPYLSLTVGPWASTAALDLDARLPFQPADRYEASFSRGTPLFTYADGRLVVPELELAWAGDPAERVRVGGTLTVPEIALRAGAETAARTRTLPPPSPHALVFRANGTVAREDAGPDAAPNAFEIGTWEATGDGAGTLTFGDVARPFRYAVERGALRLTFDDPTPTDALASIEDQLFAEPGSLEAARTETVDAYRIGR